MHEFDYTGLPAGLLTQQTMDLLAAVHECRGRQASDLAADPAALGALVESARVASAGASNRIEGIRTTDARLRGIVEGRAEPRTRDEEEIAGYRDVLATIHESHDWIEPTPGVILQLHRDLYRRTPLSCGGRFKDADNEIVGIRPDGSCYVRFRPVPAVATPDAVGRLCAALREGLSAGRVDPLLVSMEFVLDFTCVHPFGDGNGRMSRLLTLLLLYRCGYMVGKYVSVEGEIERTKGDYYEALAESSRGWDEGENDPGPFVRYMLGTVLACYRELSDRVGSLGGAGATKAGRVEEALRRSVGRVTKADLLEACPGVSRTTVERALAALLADGRIEKVGGGRSTGYVWRG